MGYTSKPIYNDKNTDLPSEIDRDWVHKLMEGLVKLDTIELYPLGENGIWRNIFVGFKDPPTSAREVDDFPARFAGLTSNAHGHWNDPLAGKKLDVGLQADKSCGKLLLEGWRPDGTVRSTTVRCSPLQSTTVHYSPLQSTTVHYSPLQSATTVSMSAQVIGAAEVGADLFKMELPVSLSEDEFF